MRRRCDRTPTRDCLLHALPIVCERVRVSDVLLVKTRPMRTSMLLAYLRGGENGAPCE